MNTVFAELMTLTSDISRVTYRTSRIAHRLIIQDLDRMMITLSQLRLIEYGCSVHNCEVWLTIGVQKWQTHVQMLTATNRCSIT